MIKHVNRIESDIYKTHQCWVHSGAGAWPWTEARMGAESAS